MPLTCLAATVLLCLAGSTEGPVSLSERPAQVMSFLAECRAAGVRLWGRPLCAPVLVVDEATGGYWSSEPPPGPLPERRANTSFEWGGRKWIMVLAPLPAEEAAHRDLLFHESWHAHQDVLGLPANNAIASHLDSWRERYFLRLEWEALAAALRSRGAARRSHIEQALAFRRQRLPTQSDKAVSERMQMRHEGLAAYTGTKLSGRALDRVLAAMETAAARPSLSRSFAYVSGPAWGLLLDDATPGWRQRLASGADLPELMPFDPSPAPDPDRYSATRILAEEFEAGRARQARIDAAMSATAEERALRIPLENMQMDFSPDRVSATPDGSVIYHRITLRDLWGEISVEGLGIRILPDFTTAFAPWPLQGGSIQLADGWRIVEQPAGGARVEPAP